MKFFVAVAMFQVLALATVGFAQDDTTNDSNTPANTPSFDDILKLVTNQIGCFLGVAPCQSTPLRAGDILQQLSCGLGITMCASENSQNAVYADGSKGHPLPAEIISAAQTFDDSIRTMLCAFPVTCPKDTRNGLNIPSMRKTLENVRTAPVFDPIIELATCRLGLTKCD